MGFRSVDFSSVVRFNSAVSSKFIELYENTINKRLQTAGLRPKKETIVPSGLRCNRKSWFRLRGTAPDILKKPDRSLNFMAEVGTARHLAIQKDLQSALGVDWLDVEAYLQENPIPYSYTLKRNNMETTIELQDPPIRFACDGILKFYDKIFLLEIKTSDHSSWESLTEPKEVHMDQIKCYATLLQIHDVLVLYEDRQFGDVKCYQLYISDSDFHFVEAKIRYIQKMANANLAPERLPVGDYMCSNCEYKEKCREWG